MICFIPKGSSQQVLLLDDDSMLRDLCPPFDKGLLHVSSGCGTSAPPLIRVYYMYHRVSRDLQPALNSHTDFFPEELQSELISFLKDRVGVSLSYAFAFAFVMWLDQGSPTKHVHQREQWREKPHLIRPLVLVPFPKASKHFSSISLEPPLVQSYEISQVGFSSWLMGNQITWGRQRLPSFSLSEVGPEANGNIKFNLLYMKLCCRYVCLKERVQNLFIKQKQTHRHRKQPMVTKGEGR